MAITWTGAAWQPTTAVVVGGRVVNGGNVYRCVVAGTTAGSGGPTGTAATPVTDGSASWLYHGASGGAVTDFAPELAASPPAASQNAILDAVDLQVFPDPCTWDTLADTGARYLAAHLGTIAKMRGRGPTVSEALGPASRGYANMLLQFGAYGATAYGMEYSRLSRTLPSALGFTP